MLTANDIIIYISCHDDASEQTAQELADSGLIPGARIIRNKPSLFFENQIFDHLHQNRHEWANKKYVGLVSYKFKEKTQEIPIPILDLINSATEEINLYYIADCQFCKHKLDDLPLSTANASTIQHSAYFLLAWLRMGQLLNIPEHVMMHDCIPFFAFNYWIADIPTMFRYLDHYNLVKHLSTTDPKMIEYLHQNSLYDGKLTKEQLIEISGKPYYTIHPFLFERLPGLFAVTHKISYKCIGFAIQYRFYE